MYKGAAGKRVMCDGRVGRREGGGVWDGDVVVWGGCACGTGRVCVTGCAWAVVCVCVSAGGCDMKRGRVEHGRVDTGGRGRV